MSYLCSRTEDRARDFLCVSFSAPTWSLILCPHRGVCVGVILDGRLMSSFETLQAALQMKWHSSDCVSSHASQTWEQGEREEMDEGNESGGVKEVEEEAWGELMELELQ